jgi:antitoxin ParD1/3/4
MALSVSLPDEVQTIVEAVVREHGFIDAAQYLTSLVRQDQKRRAKDQIEALMLAGINSGDDVELTADAWRDLRLNPQRQPRNE